MASRRSQLIAELVLKTLRTINQFPEAKAEIHRASGRGEEALGRAMLSQVGYLRRPYKNRRGHGNRMDER